MGESAGSSCGRPHPRTPVSPAAAPIGRWHAGAMPTRIAAMVAAGIAGLLSLGLLAAGGLLLWGDSQKDDQEIPLDPDRALRDQHLDGIYHRQSRHSDSSSDGADWIVNRDRFGKIRLTVDAHDSKPVFVGVGRPLPRSRATCPGRATSSLPTSTTRRSPRTTAASTAQRKPAAPAAQRFCEVLPTSARDARPADLGRRRRRLVDRRHERGRAARSGGRRRQGRRQVRLPVAGRLGAPIARLIVLSFSALLAVLGIRQPQRVAVAA